MKIIKNYLRAVLFLLISILLSACSVMQRNDKAVNQALQHTDHIYQQAKIAKPRSLLHYSKRIYLTGKAFKIEKHPKLPAVFYQKMTYTTAVQESLKQTLEHIAKVANIKLRFDNSQENASKVNPKLDTESLMKSYHGRLKDILDQMTNRVGLYWQYDKNSIKVFQTETKIYALDAPTGKFGVKNNISSASDTSGSGGSNAQSATSGTSAVNVNYDIQSDSPWSESIATIKHLISADGHMDTNAVEGYVTITDNPDKQKKIKNYIEKINDKTNKKIAVRVAVYDVQNTANSDYGMDINGIIHAFGKSISLSHNSTQLLNSSGDDNGFNTITFQNNNGDGHNAVIKALNQLGKTTEVTATTVYTISGQPAPIQNATQQSYLKSISTTSTQDAGQTVSMEPGTINTGYSMTVTPRIESTNEILLSLNLQISNLVKLDKFSVSPSSGSTSLIGGNDTSQKIQLPTIHSKNFLENMILKSGETLLVAGFQDNAGGSKTGSLGDPSWWAAGGSKSTQHVKSTTIVVITPYIIR